MNNKKYLGKYYKARYVNDLKELVLSSVKMAPDKAAYLEKPYKGGKFEPITYRETLRRMNALGTVLLDKGFKDAKVGLIGETSANWILTYFATVCGVGVIVPLDKNLPNDELVGIARRSKLDVFVFSKKLKKTVKPLFDDPQSIKCFICLDDEIESVSSTEEKENMKQTDSASETVGEAGTELTEFHSIESLVDEGQKLVDAGKRDYIDASVDPDQQAALIFTSGTTGKSKGVMLSHRNIASNVANTSKIFHIPDDQCLLSVLPAHHVYENSCSLWEAFYQCSTVAICEGIKHIQKNLSETQASTLVGVPLLFEKFYKGILKTAASRGEEDKLKRAIRISRKTGLYNNRALMKRMFKSVHKAFGGNLQKLIFGGAAADPKVIEAFEAMGFTAIQGYGMTECAPIICVNQDRYSKPASVGRPLPGTEVRIIDQDDDGIGEIICRSDSVMMGYFEDPEATAEVIIDGWLHTGDLGYMDDDGFVYITGRKKTVIVTKGGKNIFPEEVEEALNKDDLISEVLVYGVEDADVGNVIISADIYPNYQLLEERHGQMGRSEIYHFYRKLVDDLNNSMPPYKRVKRINIRRENFVKTTTGKIKRYLYGSVDKGEDGRRMTYPEIKEAEMKKAKERVKSLNESEDRFVRYKTSRPITDLKHMMRTSVELYGDNVAFRQKFNPNGKYEDITYKDAMNRVNAFGTALFNKGLDGKRIAVIGNNCFEWASTYLATLCGGNVVVPLDKEMSENELENIVIDADVACVVFEDKFKDRFVNMRNSGKTGLEMLISFKSADQENGVLSWKDLIYEGETQIGQGDRQFIDAEVIADEMAVIIYTSGTTGLSKGVMLSQTNICDNLMSAPTILDVKTYDIFFSVLPIHHTYECTCGFLMPLYKGASIAYCQGLKYIVKNMQEVHPTMFLGVALIFEALYKNIWKGIGARGKTSQFKNVLALNRFTSKIGLNIVKPLAREILDMLGGNLRCVISGGSAIDPDILRFFQSLGMIAVQGYGLTECSPMVALNPDTPGDSVPESAGHLIPGIDVKVVNKDENGIGELCFRGGNIMLGYYNNKEATDETIRDGWLYTGDLGYVDENDFIYLTGRVKNVIITKNGKNVFPEELEYYINKSPYIEESMVWGDESGDRDVRIVATVKIDKQEVADAVGSDADEKAIEDLIWEETDKINDNLPFFKKIKKVVIRGKDFDKTTGHKIKRFVNANKEQ